MNEAVLEIEYTKTEEIYARSLHSLRGLGRVSLEVIPLTSDVPEVKEAWIDFVSGLEENISTDPEYSERLTFNPLRFHEVVDNHTVDRTGRRIVDIVSDGLLVSKQQALYDERMQVQVERDEGDVLVAEAVDKLEVGEMLATVSMDPKEALLADKEFWEDKAYREGMAVLQVYFRTDDGLLAGAYAIKQSDKDLLREQLKDEGLEIPKEENCNRWTRYHLKRNISEEDARMFGDKFVKTYRQRKGLNQQQISTTEFLNDNNTEVQNFFDTYIVPLATSTATGINSESTQTLAANIHSRNAKNISYNERTHLLKLSNSDKFDDSDARFMESKIRYALIEHLRPKLLETLSVASSVENEINSTQYITSEVRTIVTVNNFQLQQMNTQLSMGLERGVQERRSYGGCSSSKTESREFGLEIGSQDVFGGKTGTEDEDSSGESDKFGPLVFKCTKGHPNKREKNGWVYECQKCGEDVSCGKKKP